MPGTVEPTAVYAAIYSVVRTIPRGQVASYGQVAKAVGLFRGARLVGWALRRLPPDTTDIPWHRVIAQDCRISIVNPAITPSEQARLLIQEGVAITEINGYLTAECLTFQLID